MLVASIRMGCQQPLTDFVFDNLDNHLNPCYTTQKPHNQAKNTPSPKESHHLSRTQESEQNSEILKNDSDCMMINGKRKGGKTTLLTHALRGQKNTA